MLRIGVQEIRLDSLSIKRHAARTWNARGFTSGEYTVDVTVPTTPDLMAFFDSFERPRVPVWCKRCGQGRLYSNGKRALLARFLRWTRHVCPRGTR